MSAETSPLTFATISSPVTQTATIVAPETPTDPSGNSSSSSSRYNPNANPFPSPDPARNSNPDPFSNGPSVYLYGFLATLVLIFLVSICVAWKGYRARRLLRARIDEAIARGVYIPGWAGGEYTPFARGAGGRLQRLPPPTIYDDWLDIKAGNENDLKVATGWDIKPTAIAAIKPYVPPPPPSAPLSHAASLLQQLLDPIREYWFVRAPDGTEPGQVQGLANRDEQPPNSQSPNPTPANEEKEIDLTDAEGLSVVVLITMPNAANASMEAYGKGKGVPRPASYQPGVGIASTSQLRQSTSVGDGIVEEQEKEDLPELMIGVAEVGIRIPVKPIPSEPTIPGNGMGERNPSIPVEGSSKAAVPAAGDNAVSVKSNSMPQ